MIARGSRVLWEARGAEVLQVSAAGLALIRLQTGEVRPVPTKDLVEVDVIPGPTSGPSFPEVPSSDPPLLKALRAWTLVDGFGFHRLLRQAVDAGVVSYYELEREFAESASTILNWTNGGQRPPQPVQRNVIEFLISRTLSSPPPSEPEAVASSVAEDTDVPEVAEADPQGTQMVEVSQKAFTIGLVRFGDIWTASVAELPIEVQAESRIEAILDAKSMIYAHLQRHTAPKPSGAKTEPESIPFDSGK